MPSSFLSVAEVYSDLKLSYLRKFCPENWWRLIKTNSKVLLLRLYSPSTIGFLKVSVQRYNSYIGFSWCKLWAWIFKVGEKSHMTFNPNTKPYFKCFWQKSPHHHFQYSARRWGIVARFAPLERHHPLPIARCAARLWTWPNIERFFYSTFFVCVGHCNIGLNSQLFVKREFLYLPFKNRSIERLLKYEEIKRRAKTIEKSNFATTQIFIPILNRRATKNNWDKTVYINR